MTCRLVSMINMNVREQVWFTSTSHMRLRHVLDFFVDEISLKSHLKYQAVKSEKPFHFRS